jgi:RNA polymerase sigma-70 factor (ECF subfamily)
VDPEQHRCFVEQARGGDAEAWIALYQHAYARLRAYAGRHGGDHIAEDLVSETMARAVAGIGRFHWEAVSFDAWLYGILRRVCADHHRRRWRPGRDNGPASVPSDGPGDDLLRVEEHAEVRRAFERLSQSERQLLELRVIAGLSAEDVAHVVGKRAGAVRSAQSRALAHLRQLLGEGQ